jgi:hypothetical protein
MSKRSIKKAARFAHNKAGKILTDYDTLTGDQIHGLGADIERAGNKIETADWEAPTDPGGEPEGPDLSILEPNELALFYERVGMGSDPWEMYEWLLEQRGEVDPGDPPVDPDPPTDPDPDPPTDPDPPIVVEPGVRVFEAWPDRFKDDTGKIHQTTRLGLAASMQAGAEHYPGDTIKHISHCSDAIAVAMNQPGKRVSVDMQPGKPLRAIVSGGTMTGLITGERYLGGAINRQSPAIEFLEFTDGTLDVRGAQSPYPFVTGVNSYLRHFGVRRYKLLTPGGPGSKVRTPIRGNASAEYQIEDIENDTGADEYAIAYINYGPGKSYVRRVKARNGGRGNVQACMRTTENLFAGAWISDADELLVEDVYSRDNGGKDGSNAVSIAGWGGGDIIVSKLDVQTKFNAGGLAITEDAKQHAVTGTQGQWTIVGPGLMLSLGGKLWAHNRVVADLAGSTIINGNITAGSPGMTSSRNQVELDSIYKLAYSAGTYGGKGPGIKMTKLGSFGAVEGGVVP